ncbi:MAG: helix-turn-helix domain-containing protein [Allosphingosinicella sp.]
MPRKRHRTFLREWRQHRGFSLEAAAAEIGMTHTNLSRIERGLYPYNQDLMESLALVYGCDPVDLLIRDPSAPVSIYAAMDRANDEQRRLIERIAEDVLEFRRDGEESG